MTDFPTTAAAVDARWLEGKLRAAGAIGDARITDLTFVPIGTGQVGDTARFTITYDRPGAGPETVAGKFPSADATSRSTAAMFGLYRKEVSFYRELAPNIDVRTAQAYGSELDENGCDFILLFEDLGPCRGGNQLTGCGIEDARHGIRQAAALHAPTWNAPWLADTEWIQPRPGTQEQMLALYPQAQALFRERYADTLESELMAICEQLNDLAGVYFTRTSPDYTVTHGDYRLDNMLFDVRGGSDPIAVVDWQTTGVGCPMLDVGYFMGCGIGSALRRPHEEELLDLYCAEMTRRGVPLTRDQIWDRYRLGALHGVSTAVFSAAFVVRTDRGDQNFLSMARNSCELCLDHDSIGALKRLTETVQC
ncbi:ecdysteroid 22-kinase family protein [Novosphingobium sp. KCTC 2891]|uniref:phosphotransferase family protein n=1 Tax=Novosphingobium sp. KCTC 2891 TaxID=2989730 RepID=UPI002222A477|nr:ecdysteroid 22-kinase family protein [Novosphingobium sp. KCTC 2891]MCW1381811.1 ecdysteroid 22-kinase family protein [Novosphingobium sp. KCTC 2891]